MREIVGDTETTGFSVKNGDRIIEIGLIETVDFMPTGRVFHEFINPERDIHWRAAQVHGLTNRALEGQPKFHDIAARLLEFIGDANLWFHNAPFDMGFLKAQLQEVGLSHQLRSVDSVNHFKKSLTLPNYKLDTIVAHYGIVTPERKVHGALLDAAILTSAITKSKNFPDLNIDMIVALGNEDRIERRGAKKVEKPAAEPKPAPKAAPREAAKEPPQAQKTADPRAPREEQWTSVIEASANRGDPLVEERFRIMSVTLRTAFVHAKSFRDFLGILMNDSVSIRPHLTLGGHLDDMRFTTRGVSFTAQDFGFDMMVFSHAPICYSRLNDSEFLGTLRDHYDRHFRAAKPVEPAASRDSEADDDLLEKDDPVHAVNEAKPSLEVRTYASLRVGRDEWSEKPHPEIKKIASARMSPDMIGVFSHIEESYKLSTMRWICRGLSPEHALCMLAARALAYKKPELSGEVLLAAKMIADGSWKGARQSPPKEEPARQDPPFRESENPDPNAENPGPVRDEPRAQMRGKAPKIDYKSIPIDRRVYELSMEMNRKPPSMEVSNYRMMRMGDDRDGWSSASHAEIDGYVIEILGDRRNEMMPAIEDFERSTSMGLKRWICRGLSPDHALCMTVARAELYSYRVGEVAMDVAWSVVGNGHDPGREP